MDTLGPSVDDLGMNMALPLDIDTDETANSVNLPSSVHDEGKSDSSLGHQGEKCAGGKNENLRVLHCTHLNLSTNYESLYDIFKIYGDIERMKMKLVNDKYFEGYVIFYKDESAQLALEGYDGSLADKARYGTKILNAKNLIDEDSDFIPSVHMNTRYK